MKIKNNTNYLNFGMHLKMEQDKLSVLERMSLDNTNKAIQKIEGPDVFCKFIRSSNKRLNSKTILLGILDKDVIVQKCESLYISEFDLKKLTEKILNFFNKI